MEGKRGLRFAAAFSFYLLVAASAGGAAAGAGFAGAPARSWVAAVHCGNGGLGNDCGAKVKLGKRVLWDRVKVDQYLNALTGVN